MNENTPYSPVNDPVPEQDRKPVDTSLFAAVPRTVWIGLGLIVAIALTLTGLSVFSIQPEERSSLVPAQSVQSDVNSDASPAYQDTITQADRQDYERSVETGESHLDNVAGSLETLVDPLPVEGSRPAEGPLPVEGSPVALIPPPDPIEPATTGGDSARTARMAAAMAGLIEGPLSAKSAQHYRLAAVQMAPAEQGPSEGEESTRGQGSGLPDKAPQRLAADVPLVSAGEVFYGVVTSSVLSTLKAPVLAEILEGPLQGGQLIGSFSRSRDLLAVRFETLSFEGKTFEVEAWLVHPDTRAFGHASSVDHHYFERFVIPVAAAALKGLATGLSAPLTTVTIAGEQVISTQRRPSSSDQLKSVAASAGAKLGEIVEQDNRIDGPTVELEAGTPIGVAFVKPVRLSGEGQP